jgi:hypothetical protein
VPNQKRKMVLLLSGMDLLQSLIVFVVDRLSLVYGPYHPPKEESEEELQLQNRLGDPRLFWRKMRRVQDRLVGV